MLARDPLACLEGFLTLTGLAFRHIFGARFCPQCPDCGASDHPCMDAFGSNAVAMGGVFGRVDAIYGSIECQKSGSLHVHNQIFIQCTHQFMTLSELQRSGPKAMLEQLRKYSDYSEHVSRKVYCDPEGWAARKRAVVEAEWPEYKTSALMLSRPAYQQDSTAEAGPWKSQYLAEDVEDLQQHKQHQVHLPDKNGLRMPLAHCRDNQNPSKCKSGFPRDTWLTDEPVLLCPGLAAKWGMPHKGKKSMVGSIWGPCNDPNLNGTHPALLAGLRCNSDVQLPYRFPFTPTTALGPGTHRDDLCDGMCGDKMPLYELTRIVQVNQAAQVGYQCDYQNKRLPSARHDMKDWGFHKFKQ